MVYSVLPSDTESPDSPHWYDSDCMTSFFFSSSSPPPPVLPDQHTEERLGSGPLTGSRETTSCFGMSRSFALFRVPYSLRNQMDQYHRPFPSYLRMPNGKAQRPNCSTRQIIYSVNLLDMIFRSITRYRGRILQQEL